MTRKRIRTRKPKVRPHCSNVELPDGSVVKVYGNAEDMTDRDREALAVLVEAAKEKYRKDHPEEETDDRT